MTDGERAKEWAKFAETDLKSAKVLSKEGIFNEVCFHSQQCAEKMLKALLVLNGQTVPKTHRLIDLLSLAVRYSANLRKMRTACLILDQYYIPTRYPDAVVGSRPTGLPTKKDAEEALKFAHAIFSKVKPLIGNPRTD